MPIEHESVSATRRCVALLLVPLLALAAGAGQAAVTIERDASDRIATAIIPATSGRAGFTHRIDAEPDADLREAPASITTDLPMGAALLRFRGHPIGFARPPERDEATGLPVPIGDVARDALFAELTQLPPSMALFASVCATSIGFAADCQRASWLSFVDPEHVPIAADDSAAFRALPAAPGPLDEALLGCGSAYGTSCADDGIDLRFADASVLNQRSPGLEAPLPDGGDSLVLETAAWNWFARQALAAGIEPGEGDAAGCTFETPEGCDALGVEPQRFAARRVLADEPIPGPPLRWDWEMGTTFELASVEVVEGSLTPATLASFQSSLPVRVHVVGPFAGANGEPDAVAYWLPEPTGSLLAAGALGALAALRVIHRSRR